MPALFITSLARSLLALGKRWRLAFGHLALVDTVRRERAALATLDDRLLADIGISREAAMAESLRDPYDLPRDRRPQTLSGSSHGGAAAPATPFALMRPLS
ncbi:MAG: DUF1127 domain-containing protein [Pseudomonadota bacterium]